MYTKKLTKWQEWFESDRIVGTSFLHGWNEKEAEEKARKQGTGELPREEEAWGVFDDAGHMQTTIVTSTRKVMFEKKSFPSVSSTWLRHFRKEEAAVMFVI